MEIVKPTVGRVVHFYHNNDHRYANAAKANATEDFVPAIVTHIYEESLSCNMRIFQDSEGALLLGKNIVHEREKQEGWAYWAWPPRV